MCKIAGVGKVTDKNRNDVWLFMMQLGELMSDFNRDGLGYAALDKKGRLFGERWLFNKTAFCDLSTMIKDYTPDKKERVYSSFGSDLDKDQAQAIILHTRMATCERGIKNTHPFIDNLEKPNTAIIHNGMIHNDDELTKKFSTCDSEVIVHLYEQMKVRENFENIKEVMSGLMGWFTVLALSTDSTGRPVMDMFTDSSRLSSYYIPELETRVYSTNAWDIEKAADMLGMGRKDLIIMRPNTAHRMDVLTGEIIDKQRGRIYRAESYRPNNIVVAEGTFDNINDDAFKKAFLNRK